MRLAPSRVTVADIIRITDGPIALTPCASRTQFGVCKDCRDARTCQLTHLMQQVRDAAAAVLEGCSIAGLAGDPAFETTVLVHEPL
jgi:DNA-binding IscR family transcriptional regulator